MPGGWCGWSWHRGGPCPFCGYLPWLPKWWLRTVHLVSAPPLPFTAYPWLPREREIELLQEQRRFLKDALSRIDRRLEELRRERSPSKETD